MSEKALSAAKQAHDMYVGYQHRLNEWTGMSPGERAEAYEARDFYHLLWLRWEMVLAKEWGYRLSVGDGDHVPRT